MCSPLVWDLRVLAQKAMTGAFQTALLHGCTHVKAHLWTCLPQTRSPVPSTARLPAEAGTCGTARIEPRHTHSCATCQVSSWGKWTPCSKKCGGGTTNRKRTVITVNKFGGKSCPKVLESKACNEKHCPVNCVVSPWAGWPSCSKTCGGGAQTTTRSVTTPAKYGGRYMLRDQPFVFGKDGHHCDRTENPQHRVAIGASPISFFHSFRKPDWAVDMYNVVDQCIAIAE